MEVLGEQQAVEEKESFRVLSNLRAVASRASSLADSLREHTNKVLLGESNPPLPMPPTAPSAIVPNESFEPGYCGAIDKARADIRDALNSIQNDLDRLNTVF